MCYDVLQLISKFPLSVPALFLSGNQDILFKASSFQPSPPWAEAYIIDVLRGGY